MSASWQQRTCASLVRALCGCVVGVFGNYITVGQVLGEQNCGYERLVSLRAFWFCTAKWLPRRDAFRINGHVELNLGYVGDEQVIKFMYKSLL